MAKRARGNAITWKQGVVALVLTISVAYGVAITDVLSRTVRSRGRVETLQSQVDALETQVVELQLEIDQSRSQSYIEKVAREELKGTKDGEVALVSVTRTAEPEATPVPPTPTSRPTPRPTTSGSLLGRWQELLRLILSGIGR